MAINLVDLLVSPSFWWVYVVLFEFFRVFMPALMHMGADKHIILEDTGHGYRQVGVKWVKKFQTFWGKHKGRVSQSEATAYTESGMLFDHGVQFTDLAHSMPLGMTFEALPSLAPKIRQYLEKMGAEFKEEEGGNPLKVTFNLIPHNPTDGKIIRAKTGWKFVPGAKYSVNPRVGDMEDHVGRQTARQLSAANALNHPGLLMLVLVGALCGLGALFAYPLLFPPHASIIQQTTTTVTTTVTTH